MGFHGFTFSQAKAIDICFDLFIGRGSQVLVALPVYPLLRRAVHRSMEVREFSLTLVLPFFMERLSAFTLWAMLTNMGVAQKRDSSSNARIARSRIRIDWRIVLVVLVGCYILSIPTFLSAMTSYQSRGEPFFPADDGSNYVSADDVKYPDAFVSHGAQLGLSATSGSRGSHFDYFFNDNNFPFYNASDPELYAACVGYYEAIYGQLYPAKELDMDELVKAKQAFDMTRDSLPLWQSITDAHKPSSWSITLWPHNVTWGENSSLSSTAAFTSIAIHVRNKTYDLDPLVNLISNFNNVRYSVESESDHISRLKHPPDPDSGTFSALKKGDTVLYTGSELATKGKCLPSKDYVWGFLSLMLFTFCILTIFILLLLIFLHYDAYYNGMADQYKLRISAFRDVLDLAEELRAHYSEADVASMSAPELDQSMQTDPATIGLETATLRNPRAARWKQRGLRLRVPKWAKKRRASGAVGSSTSDAEELLMSIGLDKPESGFGRGKMPSKVVTRQST
ncbi:hypothetical protein KC345_g6176 [Hortaea werneckii]|nr:hypothetical protein KC345_g6176 [Hortaea werneckii]